MCMKPTITLRRANPPLRERAHTVKTSLHLLGQPRNGRQISLVRGQPDGAFTLLELFAVSGTLAVLALVLVPALAGTRMAVSGKSIRIQYKIDPDDFVWLTVPGSVWVLGGQGYYQAPAAQPHTFYCARRQ